MRKLEKTQKDKKTKIKQLKKTQKDKNIRIRKQEKHKKTKIKQLKKTQKDKNTKKTQQINLIWGDTLFAPLKFLRPSSNKSIIKRLTFGPQNQLSIVV